MIFISLKLCSFPIFCPVHFAVYFGQVGQILTGMGHMTEIVPFGVSCMSTVKVANFQSFNITGNKNVKIKDIYFFRF